MARQELNGPKHTSYSLQAQNDVLLLPSAAFISVLQSHSAFSALPDSDATKKEPPKSEAAATVA